MAVDYRVGDTRDLCAQLEPGSIDLLATSPPFLNLRSYLPAEHDSKHAEIGAEASPAAFVDTLLGLTAQWGDALAPFGSIAVELGDTYSGSGGGGGDYLPGGLREGQQQFAGSAASMRESNAAHWRLKNRTTPSNRRDRAEVPHHAAGGIGWPSAKSLALVPQLYAVGLAYGLNPLTGQPSPAGRWLVRNIVVWHRPNPSVGALGDKFRSSTSYIVVATRSKARWFDLSAVRTPHRYPGRVNDPIHLSGFDENSRMQGDISNRGHIDGAPPLDAWFDQHDTWTVTTQPSSLAHYAMWPPKLAERLILSMCPAEVCRQCGEPRRRLEAKTRNVSGDRPQPYQVATAGTGRSSGYWESHGSGTFTETEQLG